MASVQSIDTDSKQVQCKSTLSDDLRYNINYDMLVVACGSVPSTFGLPGVVEHAFFLKEVHHARRFGQVRADAVVLDTGEVIPCGLVVWTAGVGPNTLTKSLPWAKSKRGNILTNQFCQVRDAIQWMSPSPHDSKSFLGLENPSAVFAIGDCADIEDYPLPATAQKAQGQALYLLGLLQKDKPSVEPYRFQSLGMMAYLGSYEGLFQAKDVTINKQHQPLAKFDGWKAWLLWRSAYLTKLGSWRLRLQVPLDWFKAMVVGRDVSRF
ncbi:hypothetical protein DYB32_006588 [Aphanomyces invadans]|uniref:Uncharacterized protein n=1 Tax=Aphanomyces invadans TaxID=157072 RepID=A0A418AS53_9STRA|nr:hypothetical protein DYB32_006588 [Aphanomyces invadans]